MSAGTIYENFFSKERHSLYFPILSNFFPSSEFFRQICETRNLGIRGSFWVKKHIWNIYFLPHFFGDWSKKRLVGKFLPACLNCNPSVRRHFLRKSNFLLKNVKFAQLFRSLSNFACFLTKKSGYQGNNLLIRKKLEEKVCRKIVFFKSLSDSEQKILNN